MYQATIATAATHTSSSARAAAALILIAGLALAAVILTGPRRKAKRERARQEAWRAIALAGARSRLAASQAQRSAFQATLRGCRLSRDDAILLDQYRADISVYRANVRDLEHPW